MSAPSLVQQSEHMKPLPAPGATHHMVHGAPITVAQLRLCCRQHSSPPCSEHDSHIKAVLLRRQ